MDSTTVICWTSPFVILGVSGLFCLFYSGFDGKALFANSVDPDQTPHYVASDLGLHCLPMTLFQVSLQETERFLRISKTHRDDSVKIYVGSQEPRWLSGLSAGLLV